MNKEITLATIWPVACHTDNIGPQSTFIAIKGYKEDGISYIPLALQKGAKTIVVHKNAIITSMLQDQITAAKAHLIFVDEPRRTLALLSAQAWGNPAEKLKIIGITGTKGKTTTAWLLAHILQSSGYKTALLSTVHNKIDGQAFKTDLTTQHPDYLHAFFHACVQQGIEYVVMEVAAQAVSLYRSAGLLFDGIIFTNFALAHGEFYNSLDEYFEAKALLFQQIKDTAPLVINADDQKGLVLKKLYPESITFGMHNQDADIQAPGLITTVQGIQAMIHVDNTFHELRCPSLIGLFNGYNILGAVAMALQLDLPIENIQKALQTFSCVPGRLERYALINGAVCFIDHAHNPLSFSALLPLLRSMTDHLIVVSGAGGDRDRTMRPELGKLMAAYGDVVILTSDNPRSENPADIMHDMLLGIPEKKRATVVCEIDREQAIKIAYSLSKPTTIVALLGKGPEQYQIIGTEKYPFSERAILQSL